MKNPRESQKNTDNIVIYNDYDRSQIVSHTVSTNEKGTIENVEALLVNFIIIIHFFIFVWINRWLIKIR